MRRLAPSLAAVALALAAPAARAEPFDIDLARLGPPDEDVWQELLTQTGTAGNAAALASEAKQRFGILSVETALAISSAILYPASTTGVSGFDFALEVGGAPVHAEDVGATPPLGFVASPWPTRSVVPSELLVTGIHVRKALPFSFELGGRLLYLSKTSYFAAQGEAKWALNEGFELIPDIAVRLAYTKLFGQRDWNLGAADLDFMVSKRFGVSAVTSFTPYVAARFTFLDASSEMIDFGPGLPSPTPRTYAAYPELEATLYRTTLGVRMTAYAMSLALETTYFGGKDYKGEAAPTRDQYPDFEVPSSYSWAFRFGFEF